jgi:molybdenum cofactor guanylyltransferase
LSVPIVILAGGEGRRIGGAKAHQKLGGISLLDHMIAKAKGYGPDVAVAVAADDQLDLPPDLMRLPDKVAGLGPLSALQSALLYAEAKGARHVLLVPCDTPFLPSDLASRLAHAIGDAQAALPVSGEHLHPTCGLWSTTAAAPLSDYVATGRRSLKGFADVLGYVAVDWPEMPDDPFFNINSPDDLAAAQQRLNLRAMIS